ncbi:hypothetical protein RFM52_16430 [Mesorhizobium sp. VK2B]|uniref:Uncharacterized protein n=1 Tax=Mesorhizobium humile TaxID=3072313 RepID=A0ABU4YIL8_9HYPH|nr:hypothetical protein [Mesorhizobium sp. VK2D]MDX8486793.1 hypothetical protein [Mesorhizobium sp. VK2B]
MAASGLLDTENAHLSVLTEIRGETVPELVEKRPAIDVKVVARNE